MPVFYVCSPDDVLFDVQVTPPSDPAAREAR